MQAISGMTQVMEKLAPALERAVISSAAAGSSSMPAELVTDVATRAGAPHHSQEVSMQLRQAST